MGPILALVLKVLLSRGQLPEPTQTVRSGAAVTAGNSLLLMAAGVSMTLQSWHRLDQAALEFPADDTNRRGPNPCGQAGALTLYTCHRKRRVCITSAPSCDPDVSIACAELQDEVAAPQHRALQAMKVSVQADIAQPWLTVCAPAG